MQRELPLGTGRLAWPDRTKYWAAQPSFRIRAQLLEQAFSRNPAALQLNFIRPGFCRTERKTLAPGPSKRILEGTESSAGAKDRPLYEYESYLTIESRSPGSTGAGFYFGLHQPNVSA